MDGTTPITTATTTVTTDTTPTTGTPAEGVDGLNAGNHVIRIENNVNVENGEKDVGKLAVWTVSSAKPGNGVDLLVDDKNDTYWQSDGTQPHLITLQFQQTVEVSRIAVQTDYRMDESYTPQKLSVRIGTRWSDMKVLRTDEVQEPQGWIVIPLGKGSVSGYPGRILQIGILANHQNGRDTHVRQIKVFGPREDVLSSIRSDVRWMTSEATMYATCR